MALTIDRLGDEEVVRASLALLGWMPGVYRDGYTNQHYGFFQADGTGVYIIAAYPHPRSDAHKGAGAGSVMVTGAGTRSWRERGWDTIDDRHIRQLVPYINRIEEFRK